MKSIKLDLNNNAEWRSVKDYPNYIVSNDGRVANVETGKLLKPVPDRDGYLLIVLCKFGMKKRFKLHRLVLTTFVGECPDGLICCHNDDIKTNNHLSNLRWDTRSENQKDRNRNGKNFTTKPLKLNRDGQVLMQSMHSYGFSQRRIADFFGFSRTSTADIIHEKGRWVVKDPFDFLDDF